MRKIFTGVGAVLLIAAVALFAGQVLGLMPSDALSIGGQNSLRTVASVAVGGCLMIAIGCWEH